MIKHYIPSSEGHYWNLTAEIDMSFKADPARSSLLTKNSDNGYTGNYVKNTQLEAINMYVDGDSNEVTLDIIGNPILMGGKSVLDPYINVTPLHKITRYCLAQNNKYTDKGEPTSNCYVGSFASFKGVEGNIYMDRVSIYSPAVLSPNLCIRFIAKAKSIYDDSYTKLVLLSTSFSDDKKINLPEPFLDNGVMMCYKYEFVIPKITDIKNQKHAHEEIEDDIISVMKNGVYAAKLVNLDNMTDDLGIELYWNDGNANKNEIITVTDNTETFTQLYKGNISFVDYATLSFLCENYADKQSFAGNYIEITPAVDFMGETLALSSIDAIKDSAFNKFHLYTKISLKEWYVKDEYTREEGGYKVDEFEHLAFEYNTDRSEDLPVLYRPVITHPSCVKYEVSIYGVLTVGTKEYVFAQGDDMLDGRPVVSSSNTSAYGKKMGYVLTSSTAPVINVYNKRFDTTANNGAVINLTPPSHSISGSGSYVGSGSGAGSSSGDIYNTDNYFNGSDGVVYSNSDDNNIYNNNGISTSSIEQFCNVVNIICSVTKMNAVEVEEEEEEDQ